MFNIKLLILTENYPNDDNKYAMSYVHSRNLVYKKHFEIDVLNFKADKDYIYEGINVITLNTFIKKNKYENYNLLISHAPNVKNHVRFINKYFSFFENIIYIIHGHEVLPLNKYYPKSYFFNKNKFKEIIQYLYDGLKLFILSSHFNSLNKSNKISYFFVSLWMKDHFMKNIKMSSDYIMKNSKIIHNAANEVFIKNKYQFDSEKKLADFISIRPFDQPKYALDIIIKFAKSNPLKTFHIYGKGDYFKYNSIPKNVKVINDFVEQKDIPILLNKYTCALMPTRLDSQGVMVCEIATYGMPCITSDLTICREMFSGFPNVEYISNVDDKTYEGFSIDKILFNQKVVPDRFHTLHTVNKEIDFIKSLM